MAVCGLSCLQSGDSLNGLGMCSSGRGRLWYAAGFGGWWLQFWQRVFGEYVLLNLSDVFPSPVVSVALGLDVVASWGRGSVDDDAGYVSALVSQGQEQYFLARV